MSGLVSQIAHAIDTAFVGNTVTNGPSGLLSITPTVVDSGATLTNLDSFLAARYESLLQFDANGLTIAGLPVLTRPSVDATTVAWGIDSRRTVLYSTRTLRSAVRRTPASTTTLSTFERSPEWASASAIPARSSASTTPPSSTPEVSRT